MVLSLIWLVFTSGSVLGIHGGTILGPCTHSDVCDPNQFCSPAGICSCNPGLQLFDNECEPRAEHGQICEKQIHCSLTKDPHLHCLPTQGSAERTCQCRNGYEFRTGHCQPLSASSEPRPSHITLSKPQSKPDDGTIDFRNTNLTMILNRKHERPPKKSPGLFGPVVLVSTCVLIFALCLCFWTVRRPEGEAGEASRLNNGQLAGNPEKYLSHGIPIGHPDSDNCHIDMTKMASHDNPGYQGDNMDALSHFTGTTDVCDDSHKDYLENQDHPAKIANVLDLSAQAQESVHNVTTKSPNLAEKNVKMLFVNDQNLSMTPSMDEADQEVAGIYKTYSSMNPLTVRMESLATPPPNPQPPKQPHVIELIETPDCTSIDTTLPEDGDDDTIGQASQFKPESIPDDPKADEEPDCKTPTNPERSSSSEPEAIPDVDFQQQSSDFIDNVFKPVFSIS